MKYKTIVVAGCLIRVKNTKKRQKEIAPILAADKSKIQSDWNKNILD